LTYSYNWSGPNAFHSSLQNPIIPNVTSAEAGNYAVSITNASGCVSPITTVYVSVYVGLPLSVTTSTTNAHCNGSNSGSATANVTGGIPPYTYLWGPGYKTTQTITGLSAGSYTLMVTDALSQTIGAGININNRLTPLAPIVSSNSPLSVGDTLHLFATSIDTFLTYSYNWSGPNSFHSSLQNPIIPNVTSAEAGIYAATIISAAGCVSPTTAVYILVNTGLPLTVTTSITNVFCNGV
jgi:hypothetical protein